METVAPVTPAPDLDLTAEVDRLLREDPRLVRAAALLGRVAVLPLAPPRPAKPAPKAEDGEAEAPAGPPPTPPAWRVAQVRKISPALRELFRGRYALTVTIDPDLWPRLPAEARRGALVHALRGVAVGESKAGEETITIERPPIQCWPDTADDTAEVLAALVDAGAWGAQAVAAAEAARG